MLSIGSVPRLARREAPVTRLRADIRLPPALAATWQEHAADLPTLTDVTVRGMRAELNERGIPIPPEAPPSQQAQAARARWSAPTGDVYAKPPAPRRPRRCTLCNRAGHTAARCQEGAAVPGCPMALKCLRSMPALRCPTCRETERASLAARPPA